MFGPQPTMSLIKLILIIASYGFYRQSSTGFALYMTIRMTRKAIMIPLRLSSMFSARVRKMLHIVRNWSQTRCNSMHMMVKTCFLIKNTSSSRSIGNSGNVIFASYNTTGQDWKPWSLYEGERLCDGHSFSDF